VSQLSPPLSGTAPPQRRLALALLLAAAVLVADQATKLWVLDGLRNAGALHLLPMLDFVFVRNSGVSFGMFNNGAGANALVFSLLAAAIVAGLLAWLWRGAHGLNVPAIGLVVGGAAGNVVDRLRLGFVVDFVDAHWGEWHWPAFNLADAAICVGVGLMVIDGLLPRREGAN
jgi:signal peptidase II